ncbi:MAG: RsmB/NOP family class I SAM-dependent RNA methyltransferase [Bacteroidetes bacterium]|nr:RsmB/NOP family class I SAM-dependent RNA methyltransferase [Bacteroidota bacterium]
MAWTPSGFKIDEALTESILTDFLTGKIVFQEESAMTAVHLMDIRPGQRILDLCAAPGNKTAQISTRLGETGMVVANDISKARLGVLHGTIDRLGLTNVATTAYDARHFPIPQVLFDHVIADVPCTCEGTSRKHPRILSRNNPDERKRLIRIQTEILLRAIECTRPGGTIVYSTCTYAPEENEGVIQSVLDSKFGVPSFEILPVKIPGLTTSPGLTGWNEQSFDASMVRCARIWPHQNDTGGFFLALLRRTGKPDESLTEASTSRLTPLSPGEWPWKLHAFNEEDLLPWRNLAFSKKYNRFVGVNCVPPTELRVQSIGMTGLNLKSDHPKFSTALAIKIGHLAQSAWAEIRPESLFDFWERKRTSTIDFKVGPEDVKTVVVRCGGVSLGLGSLQFPEKEIDSRFPKVWGGLQISERLQQIREL